MNPEEKVSKILLHARSLLARLESAPTEHEAILLISAAESIWACIVRNQAGAMNAQ